MDQQPAADQDATQPLGQNGNEQQHHVQQPNAPSMGGINIDVRNAHQLNDNNNNQLIVNLYQCIQGLQAQVAQLQS